MTLGRSILVVIIISILTLGSIPFGQSVEIDNSWKLTILSKDNYSKIDSFQEIEEKDYPNHQVFDPKFRKLDDNIIFRLSPDGRQISYDFDNFQTDGTFRQEKLLNQTQLSYLENEYYGFKYDHQVNDLLLNPTSGYLLNTTDFDHLNNLTITIEKINYYKQVRDRLELNITEFMGWDQLYKTHNTSGYELTHSLRLQQGFDNIGQHQIDDSWINFHLIFTNQTEIYIRDRFNSSLAGYKHINHWFLFYNVETEETLTKQIAMRSFATTTHPNVSLPYLEHFILNSDFSSVAGFQEDNYNKLYFSDMNQSVNFVNIPEDLVNRGIDLIAFSGNHLIIESNNELYDYDVNEQSFTAIGVEGAYYVYITDNYFVILQEIRDANSFPPYFSGIATIIVLVILVRYYLNSRKE